MYGCTKTIDKDTKVSSVFLFLFPVILVFDRVDRAFESHWKQGSYVFLGFLAFRRIRFRGIYECHAESDALKAIKALVNQYVNCVPVRFG